MISVPETGRLEPLSQPTQSGARAAHKTDLQLAEADVGWHHPMPANERGRHVLGDKPWVMYVEPECPDLQNHLSQQDMLYDRSNRVGASRPTDLRDLQNRISGPDAAPRYDRRGERLVAPYGHGLPGWTANRSRSPSRRRGLQ